MRRISNLALAFLSCALTALLLTTSGPRLSGQSPQETQPPTKKSLQIVPLQKSQPTSGAQMFKDYCASCHGVDGRGNGPAVVFLKTPPADLRMIAQRNNGKFPATHVRSEILSFGPGTHAHGDLDMPIWGPLFRSRPDEHTGYDFLRIANLTDFIKSIQDK
jgi:Cytochrome c